ncbi:MAG: hypothetical protein ACLVC1_00320 [Mediterraneibacter gnavus]
MDICGYITKEAADLTGLIEGTPVAAVGCLSGNACGIASGLDREEKLCGDCGERGVSMNLFANIRFIT